MIFASPYVFTVTSLLQRSVKPKLLCHTTHKQSKAFCKWFISKSKHTYIYIPHVLEVKTWIKADLKRCFWLVFAILGSLLPKSAPVFKPSGITETLTATLALYLQHYMANVIFGRELESSEHANASFCFVQSAEVLNSLADTHLSVGSCVPTSFLYNANLTGDKPHGNTQRREILGRTSVTHSGCSTCVWQITQNSFRLCRRVLEEQH